ncbi:hypothetical protein PSHT_13546 [Puccinia striiformis]|uniref:Uncharacterized protein n=1 Tax=Puccinia striiformis TaxID=27350 RepID=A0A2S4UQ43_9BASI|nr:hypothetical protein PSHT_13546 [Puccinia striiformis]
MIHDSILILTRLLLLFLLILLLLYPRFPHNVLRSVLGTHLTQKLAAFFSGTDHASGREDEHHLRSRARSSKRLKSGSLSTSFQNLVSLLWLIGVVYGLVWNSEKIIIT